MKEKSGKKQSWSRAAMKQRVAVCDNAVTVSHLISTGSARYITEFHDGDKVKPVRHAISKSLSLSRSERPSSVQ